MARSFSASLNSAFAIDDSTASTPELNNLAQSVSQKKAAVDSQTSELQALEARIKEMDKRLEQKMSRTSSPAGRGGAAGGGSEHRRSPLGDTFSGGGDGGVNAAGPAGNYYGAKVTGTEGGTGTQSVNTSSVLADRTVNPSSGAEHDPVERTMQMPGGMENLSASANRQ